MILVPALMLPVSVYSDEEVFSNSQIIQGLQQGVFQIHQRGREAYVRFQYFFGD